MKIQTKLALLWLGVIVCLIICSLLILDAFSDVSAFGKWQEKAKAERLYCSARCYPHPAKAMDPIRNICVCKGAEVYR